LNLGARDKGVSREKVAKWIFGGLGDTDARSNEDLRRAKTVVADPQAGIWRSEIAAVVVRAGDVKGFGEASGAGREFQEVAWPVDVDSASFGHFFHAGEWFEGAEQDASSFAFRLAGDVEAVVISIDEIDISVAGRAEENGIAHGLTDRGVGGKVILAEISFDFDDAGREGLWAGADQDLAKQIARDTAWRPSEKRSRKWTGGHDRSLLAFLATRNKLSTNLESSFLRRAFYCGRLISISSPLRHSEAPRFHDGARNLARFGRESCTRDPSLRWKNRRARPDAVEGVDDFAQN
jgi:hypothetical protein